MTTKSSTDKATKERRAGASSKSKKQSDAKRTDANAATVCADTTTETVATPQRSAAKDAERFTRGVVTRGEAAEADADGELPSGATHEIVEEGDADNLPTIKRRRYTAF